MALIKPLGDSAIVVQFSEDVNVETHQKVHALCGKLERQPIQGMIECVPAFTSVTVYYDCYSVISQKEVRKEDTPYDVVFAELQEVLSDIDEGTAKTEAKEVIIPVYYGGEFGIDLEVVAKHNDLSPEEVIRIHSEGAYLTYMIGFSPGFPYLGGLSEKLHTPRRQNPRLAIPAGTVGIAGKQTGIYSMETPGGWQLIGRTPLKLFHPDHSPPTLIQAGNYVKFQPITKEEYDDYLSEELK